MHFRSFLIWPSEFSALSLLGPMNSSLFSFDPMIFGQSTSTQLDPITIKLAEK